MKYYIISHRNLSEAEILELPKKGANAGFFSSFKEELKAYTFTLYSTIKNAKSSKEYDEDPRPIIAIDAEPKDTTIDSGSRILEAGTKFKLLKFIIKKTPAASTSLSKDQHLDIETNSPTNSSSDEPITSEQEQNQHKESNVEDPIEPVNTQKTEDNTSKEKEILDSNMKETSAKQQSQKLKSISKRAALKVALHASFALALTYVFLYSKQVAEALTSVADKLGLNTAELLLATNPASSALLYFTAFTISLLITFTILYAVNKVGTAAYHWSQKNNPSKIDNNNQLDDSNQLDNSNQPAPSQVLEKELLQKLDHFTNGSDEPANEIKLDIPSSKPILTSQQQQKSSTSISTSASNDSDNKNNAAEEQNSAPEEASWFPKFRWGKSN